MCRLIGASWLTLTLGLTLGLANTTGVSADDVPNKSSDKSPGDSAASAQPSFSRHVVPLFSRLGCNAGACHGKVKGENGFALSLFGVDPQRDHAALVRDHGGRRVNLENPSQSLLLLKPSGAIAHAGGRLLSPDSHDYRLLATWLEQGAALNRLDESRVERLTVAPDRLTLRPGESAALTVTATFSNGDSEEVTPFCRFTSVYPDIVQTNMDGRATALATGDSAIVVRYGAEPAVASVIVPGPTLAGRANASAESRNFIDQHVQSKLRTLNVPISPICDDATFLRRASLDISGALPEPAEVRAFLADTSSSKRQRKIDELLERPGHSALWATKFCDVLRPTGFDANYALIESAESRRFYEWIRTRLTENVPYDELAARILLATSREERTYEAWIDEVLALAEENARQKPDLKIYAARKTLDLYWQRKDATGVKGAVQVAHAFLGLRMECAQCHRHPHDVWSQDDLLSFANFFTQLKGARYPDKKQMPDAIAKMFDELPKEAKKLEEPLKQLREKKLKDIQSQVSKTKDEANKARSAEPDKRDEAKIKELDDKLAKLSDEKTQIEQEIAQLESQRGRMQEGPKRFGTDVRHDGERRNYANVSSPLGSQRSERFRLLGQRTPLEFAKEVDPRTLVVEWLRSADNPYFARSLVNRVWAHYFGRGIVDPPDQLSPLNPPSHPELLDELSRQFIEHKYDLKWLHRTIANSGAYQLSAEPATDDPALQTAARRNFGFFQLRRLSAELLVDAVNQTTGSHEEFPNKLFTPVEARALEVAGGTRVDDKDASLSYAFKVFGRPERSVDVQCDCDRDPGATVVQALYLANHPRVRDKIYGDNGRVARIVMEHSDNQACVDEIYLMTVSRLPTDDERATVMAYVGQRESSLRSFQDVLWSLLNTREFLLNH